MLLDDSRYRTPLSAPFLTYIQMPIPMLNQDVFSRSTAPVSQSCALVSQTTWLGWLFEMVLSTPHADMWVFTTLVMGIFPNAISDTIIVWFWSYSTMGNGRVVLGMIDRWAWLAHGPQMCCFLPLLHCNVDVLHYSMLCWGLLLSIEIGST